MIQYRASQSDLLRLKSPLGTLLVGSPSQTMPRLADLVKASRPPVTVAVGDVVSRETLAADVPVDVRIVDLKTLRESVASTPYPAKQVFRTKNPAGVITTSAWHAIKEALRTRDSLIIVEGEEDLLALPCLLESPDNSFVLYGQPKEGLVVVVSSQEKKRDIRALIDGMTQEYGPD